MQNQTTSVYVPVETPDNKIWAFILALLVHCGVIAFAIYANQVRSLDGDAMETSIITPDELAAMQGQIKANQAAANAQANLSFANNAQSTNPEIAKLNADIAQKQAKWQQQQAAIAAHLDKEAKQEQQAFANQIKQQKIEESQTLDDFKEAEITPDKFDGHRDDASKGKVTMSNSEGSAGIPSKTDTSSHDFGAEGLPTASGKTNGQSNNGNGKNAAAEYLNTIKSKIQSNWTPPAGSKGKTLVGHFDISPSGNISNISTSGSGDAEFTNSLIEAINASNPLPPPPSESYAKFKSNNFTFKSKN